MNIWIQKISLPLNSVVLADLETKIQIIDEIKQLRMQTKVETITFLYLKAILQHNEIKNGFLNCRSRVQLKPTPFTKPDRCTRKDSRWL